nr:sulfatase-like hydrolase/transferase [Haloferax volcanii]
MEPLHGHPRPYEPPGEYATLYTDETISGRNAQSLYQRAIKDPDSITDDERQLLIDLYDAEIRYNDKRIGEFLDALRERGLLENSLVVFTADHGDAFGEHGYYEHPRYLHDEITHVPLIVRQPNGESGVVETPASTLDIVSTIESAFGGESELSLVDPAADTDRRVFSQARGENEDSHLRQYAVRTAETVCFCEQDTESGGIHFENNPDEALRSELESYVLKRSNIDLQNEVADSDGVDEEIERRLSALGYKD